MRVPIPIFIIMAVLCLCSVGMSACGLTILQHRYVEANNLAWAYYNQLSLATKIIENLQTRLEYYEGFYEGRIRITIEEVEPREPEMH